MVIVLPDDALSTVARILCGPDGEVSGPDDPIRLSSEDDTYTVTAGGVRFLDTPLQVEAVIAYTLAHSVFNINFSRKPKAFLLFMQKVVLKIDDGIKLPSKVAKLVQELGK